MANSSQLTLNLQEARTQIAAIRRLDLRNTSIEEIKDMLTPILRGYYSTGWKIKSGVRLFRIRICSQPNNMCELLYPPLDLTPLGRVNRPGNPVLYCCGSRNAPFFESRPVVGASAVIAHWITTDPMFMNGVGYTTKTLIGLGSTLRHSQWESKPVEVPDHAANEEIAEFLAETFTQIVPQGSEHLYK